MIAKLALTVLHVALVMPSNSIGAAQVADRSTCLQTLSATHKPVFAGLKATKFDIENDSSTEGGEYQIFSNARGIPIYVVASQYGETGKMVALYKLLNGATNSYSIRMSNYRYVEPIYSGTVKVADVETSSFIVCGNEVVRGVGSRGVSQDLLTVAKELLARGMELYRSREATKNRRGNKGGGGS